MKSINDMIGDRLAITSNMTWNSQEEVKDTLKYHPLRMMPENSSLMTLSLPPAIPTLFLQLDTALIMRQLQDLRGQEIDYEWPQNPGQATVAASRSTFDKVWNSPEEDEAWRDL